MAQDKPKDHEEQRRQQTPAGIKLSADRSIEDPRKLLEEILAQTPISVAILDRQGIPLLCNQAFYELFGLPQDAKLSSLPAFSKPATEDPDNVAQGTAELIERAYAGEVVQYHGIEFVSPFGKRSITAGKIYPVFDDEGKVLYVVLAHHDITNKMRNEEDQTHRRIAALSSMAGGIAHDLSNVLTELLGTLALARMALENNDSDARQSVSDLVGMAQRSCHSAARIGRRLVTFSSGGKPYTKAIDTNALIQRVVHTQPDQRRVVVETPDDLWRCQCDEEQVHEALSVLVSSAIKVSPPESSVTITAWNHILPGGQFLRLDQERHVLIRITDQGSPVPAEHIPHIFNPYFAGDSNRDSLALAIAHSVTTHHGGRIWVDSTPGRGMRVSLYLPAAKQTNRSEPRPRPPITRRTPTSRNILLMDDETGVLHVTIRMLEQLGYRVMGVSNGTAAIDAYQKAMGPNSPQPFDLVILDMTVNEGMGGLEAFSLLKAADPSVRVVLATGYSQDPVLANFTQHGFAGALRKPYRLSDLQRVVEQALGSTRFDEATGPSELENDLDDDIQEA